MRRGRREQKKKKKKKDETINVHQQGTSRTLKPDLLVRYPFGTVRRCQRRVGFRSQSQPGGAVVRNSPWG